MIVEWLNVHISVITQLRHLFPTCSDDSWYTKACDVLYRLERQRQIYVVGTLAPQRRKRGTKGGRRRIVYGRWYPARNQVRHEVTLTQFCLQYPKAKFIRGNNISEENPDGIMYLNGEKFFLEMDMGTHSVDAVRDRLEKAYRRVNPDEASVLFITTTERRLEGVRKAFEPVGDLVLGTTLDRVEADPGGEIWQDFDGDVCSI